MSKIKINKSESVTSRLGFKPSLKFNNLCIAKLTNIEVTESDIAEDSKWEYNGKTVPRLAFHFEQWKESPTDPDRFYSSNEMLIAGIKSDSSKIDEKNLIGMYTELWKRIKHLFDAYIKAPNFKDMAFDIEFDPADPIDKRIADMKKFFNNVVDAFNSGTDGKPIYLNQLLAMKLIATENRGKNGKTYYTLELPNYVGKGTIQAVDLVDGKLNTTLEFTGGQTVDLSGATTITGGEANTAAGSGLPDDIKAKLNIG